MIANFYKMQYGNYRNSVLLVTRNIEHIPSVKTVVIYIMAKSFVLTNWNLIWISVSIIFIWPGYEKRYIFLFSQ